ncbi:bifunctional metallophosphatase/5'-nucleotidase [Rhodospirillum rubrum]|uniref:5'-Nucleotidase n=1 Tax=Rhodospirillum rubrum (strain ATCC 11170 / ATH 1.1.1 / DSM 467 / LMG 4362 / NCIMB 8255 / S1) TaxID=269796 RepID=Q2RRG2_RHORT|nr:5'-nucleotidase C-terminal domain-containing protein [Rhodospirillum rubrum]ABC23283.1 5'-Nucleotidase [Rhodospirillum rubrum ATCC 11170]AEO49015.1 5'-nucleotidase [Rhodospirillum rubrum F11]MBK5954953.1 bifunctional metallophosphatase/5'-nucleotidase [Rhodospirillum rubrum]QXG79258.1 5'-nucleotidase C-terminal domain-containing protein [Rhodospirillum rubrum]HAQ00679.1 bifunctional metallophosphatase/5'-nucleotidase [Rhodospirillum rubrum]
MAFSRWLVGFLLALSLVAPAMAEDGRPAVTLRLLHLNDIAEVGNGGGSGGLAEMKTLIEAEKARPGATAALVTFGGDLLSPSLLSSIDKGAHMVEAMGLLGVDLAVPGNHEFDFGPKVFAERLSTSPFPWLASNLDGPALSTAEGAPITGLTSTAIRAVGPYKIGFLGLLTPQTTVLSSPGPEVRFAEPLAAARAAVATLKAEGADVIIALTHQGQAEDRALAQALPEVAVVVGGHDHDSLSWRESTGLVLKAGANARYLGVIDLRIDEQITSAGSAVVVLPEWSFRANVGLAPSPAVAARLAAWEAQLASDLDQPLGVTTTELDSRRSVVRGAESTMGNLVTDAMRLATGAQAALTNGGGLRGDRLYNAGTALTRRDILAELPFGNVAVVLDLTGAQVKAALENGVSQIAQGAGRFPQVSGMEVLYDPALPVGERVVALQIDGRTVEPEGHYTVAVNDYIARGGDGYDALGGGRPIIDAAAGRLLVTLVADHIAQAGRIGAQIEGRLVLRK